MLSLVLERGDLRLDGCGAERIQRAGGGATTHLKNPRLPFSQYRQPLCLSAGTQADTGRNGLRNCCLQESRQRVLKRHVMGGGNRTHRHRKRHVLR